MHSLCIRLGAAPLVRVHPSLYPQVHEMEKRKAEDKQRQDQQHAIQVGLRAGRLRLLSLPRSWLAACQKER